MQNSAGFIFAYWYYICTPHFAALEEDDILKQSYVFLSIRWLSCSSCSDSRPLTMETALFVKSHFKKRLLSESLPRGVNKRLELSKSQASKTRFTEFTEPEFAM